MDEAGRGPLAGPVSVAALYIDREADLSEILSIVKKEDGFRDSKKLSVKKREALFDAIKKNKHIHFAHYLSSAKYVDKHGIKKAIEKALSLSLKKLDASKEDEIALDGALCAPSGFSWTSTPKGDEKVLEIALASIVAKVMRDKYMEKIAKKYPEYKFENHKGYGTKEHRELILKYGICPEHRESFLRNILS